MGAIMSMLVGRVVVYNNVVDQDMEVITAEKHNNVDRSDLYKIDVEKLSKDLQSLFVPLGEDSETKLVFEACRVKSNRIIAELFDSIAQFILSWFMHQTSINGLLKRGSTFVFSKKQFQQLLNIDDKWHAQRMIDLGAGDGAVTKQMSRHFDTVCATDASSVMIWRLKQLNYNVADIEKWSDCGCSYDLISCLNLLDRCSRPLALLKQIRSALVPRSGFALISVVLPFRPYVEFNEINGSGENHEPSERLVVSGQTLEEQLTSLIKDTFIPMGFTVERYSRVPYMYEGDRQQAYYILNDAIFVLRTTS